MTETQSLQVGDFARNTIHKYVTFIFRVAKIADNFVDGVVVDNSQGIQLSGQIGFIRLEVLSELEKVEPTLQMILQAQGFLNNLNSETYQQIDNLTYVEILNKLREQEKALENKL